ncbi:hypothetical protein [Desulfobacula sp.]|uniref:hypothetical protein n=1 Tax=Desulfobacula sp. TaxID=2593537 RepID=UPI0026107080|nr:hypothetical protein [Desulfobacula sp.]
MRLAGFKNYSLKISNNGVKSIHFPIFHGGGKRSCILKTARPGLKEMSTAALRDEKEEMHGILAMKGCLDETKQINPGKV